MSQDNRWESACKNCSHPISSHKPNCDVKTNESDEACGCGNPQYHNAIVSGNYIGWTEIHCTSCGVMLGFIDSTREDIYDYITLCPNCIAKAHHAAPDKES